ncbi:MAG: hypothetical protein J6U54_16015 [Clostridiales bacterium]|nr:hypothetical protein [Clostridiales bacterium]
MKYTAKDAWEMSLKNRHSTNIRDYINEAIVQAIREGKSWCMIMIDRKTYKDLVAELNDKDYIFYYNNGMLTISWFEGGASNI